MISSSPSKILHSCRTFLGSGNILCYQPQTIQYHIIILFSVYVIYFKLTSFIKKFWWSSGHVLLASPYDIWTGTVWLTQCLIFKVLIWTAKWDCRIVRWHSAYYFHAFWERLPLVMSTPVPLSCAHLLIVSTLHYQPTLLHTIEMMGLKFDDPSSTLSSVVIENSNCTSCINCTFKLQPLKPKFECKSNSTHFLMLLLLVGDTEVKPGPRPITYPSSCKKPAKWGQNCLQWAECEGWFHKACMVSHSGLTSPMPRAVSLGSVLIVANLITAKFLPSIFDKHVSLNLFSNSFSQLEDTLLSDEDLGGRIAASSPTETNNPSQTVPPVQCCHKLSLKAIVVMAYITKSHCLKPSFRNKNLT